MKKGWSVRRCARLGRPGHAHGRSNLSRVTFSLNGSPTKKRRSGHGELLPKTLFSKRCERPPAAPGSALAGLVGCRVGVTGAEPRARRQQRAPGRGRKLHLDTGTRKRRAERGRGASGTQGFGHFPVCTKRGPRASLPHTQRDLGPTTFLFPATQTHTNTIARKSQEAPGTHSTSAQSSDHTQLQLGNPHFSSPKTVHDRRSRFSLRHRCCQSACRQDAAGGPQGTSPGKAEGKRLT